MANTRFCYCLCGLHKSDKRRFPDVSPAPSSPRQSHYHERSGIGIGCGTVFGKNCGRQDVVLHRITRLRIDGVRIFLAILIVEVAIVAAGSHGDVAHVNHFLQFLVGIERVVGWLIDADAPQDLLLVVAAHHDFATNLHHEVLDAFLLQNFATTSVCNL